VNFLPSIPSDAKKFLQFGPSLRGYFPQPAESALGFLALRAYMPPGGIDRWRMKVSYLLKRWG
jgi:hypothetical protein